MWSVLVLFLGPQYGIDPAGKFLLTAVPALVGSVLRIPYTLAVARFGGRNWTIISASLLLIPAILAAFLIKPGVSYSTLLILAAIAGVGVATSHPRWRTSTPSIRTGSRAGRWVSTRAAATSVSRPSSSSGCSCWPSFGAGHPGIVAGIYIPLIVVATAGSALFMDNLSQARNERRGMRDAAREPHTWIMSFLYIGTFGSFIGFGFAFGQVLQVQFAGRLPAPRSRPRT